MRFLLDNRILSIDFLSWINKMRTEATSQCLQVRLRVKCSLCFEAKRHIVKRSADAPVAAEEGLEVPSWKTFLEVLQLHVQTTYEERQREVDKEPFSLQPLSWGQHIKLMLLLAMLSSGLQLFPSCRKESVLTEGERGSRSRAVAQNCWVWWLEVRKFGTTSERRALRVYNCQKAVFFKKTGFAELICYRPMGKPVWNIFRNWVFFFPEQ